MAMVPASSAEPGKLYKCSRADAGPVIFYEFVDDRARRRLERRLTDKLAKQQITTEELAILRSLRAGARLAVRYIRGTSGGTRYEHERWCAIPLNYELREIARPPGFARRQPKQNELRNEEA